MTEIKQLEELYTQRDEIALNHQQAIEDIIPADIRARLAELDSEHEAEMEQITNAIKSAENQVKTAVLQAGETAKGERLQAVYTPGRVSWDTKKLERYFESQDPDALARYRKRGAPSVSLREIK